MSGGSYNYKYQQIQELADMLSPQRGSFQPIRDRMAKALREISQQCHDIEWIDSCDYGEDDWPPIEKWLEEHKF